MPETHLQQARRHVEEGRQRIARQGKLIAELAQGGHVRLLPQAESLLERMRDALREMEAHLEHEEREAAGPGC